MRSCEVRARCGLSERRGGWNKRVLACVFVSCDPAATVRATRITALATITVALLAATSAAASSDQTVSPRDNCGGFNGHVVVSDGSTPTLQLYGEVWDNTCPGSTSVWLAWQSPGYHNIQVQAADESATAGVNYTTVALQLRPVDIQVTACSTYGGWRCGTPVSVPDASAGPGSSGWRSGRRRGASSGSTGGSAAPTAGPATPPQATNGSGREPIVGTKLDLAGAAAWALNNVFGSPGLFGPNDGFGDDCTDFVSRALAIGGGDPETVLNGRSTSNDHYWYFSTFRYGRWWSHSWSVAEDLAVHLNLLHSTWLRYWRDARPGDVIFVDWTKLKLRRYRPRRDRHRHEGRRAAHHPTHAQPARGHVALLADAPADARRRSTERARLDRRAQPGLKAWARRRGRGPAEHDAARRRKRTTSVTSTRGTGMPPVCAEESCGYRDAELVLSRSRRTNAAAWLVAEGLTRRDTAREEEQSSGQLRADGGIARLRRPRRSRLKSRATAHVVSGRGCAWGAARRALPHLVQLASQLDVGAHFRSA